MYHFNKKTADLVLYEPHALGAEMFVVHGDVWSARSDGAGLHLEMRSHKELIAHLRRQIQQRGWKVLRCKQFMRRVYRTHDFVLPRSMGLYERGNSR